ncbi:4299_t:CDS:2, partial [Gigaspora margarita]
GSSCEIEPKSGTSCLIQLGPRLEIPNFNTRPIKEKYRTLARRPVSLPVIINQDRKVRRRKKTPEKL